MEAAAKKAAKKAEREAAKAVKAAERKAAAEVKVVKTKRKKDIKQRKEDWKSWIISNRTDARFSSFEEEEERLNVTRCNEYFKLRSDELRCLPHDEKFNANGLVLSRLYKYHAVVQLAYKKEAILAGSLTYDDEMLVVRGKALWEKTKP